MRIGAQSSQITGIALLFARPKDLTYICRQRMRAQTIATLMAIVEIVLNSVAWNIIY